MGILDAPGLSRSPFRPVLVKPSGLRRFRAAMGDVDYAQVIINCYGDSITAGAKAQNTVSSTPDLDWALKGYVTRLRQGFARTYADPGEGYIRLRDEPRIVFGGSATAVSSYGPYSSGTSLTSAKTITLTTPQCTSIEVAYWWDNNNTQTFTATVDGGAAFTSTTRNATSTFYKETVASGLADTTHTLVITGTSATVGAAISGIRVLRQTASGVQVNRIAQSGATTGDLIGSALSPTSQDVLKRATGLIFPSTLSTFAFGANDYLAQVPTPTVFKSNLKVFTDYQTANGGCSLLIAGPRRAESVAPGPSATYPQALYYQQMRDLASENDHVAFMDLAEVWGTFEQATALGMIADTSVHPNRRGHGDIGRIIHRILAGPGMGE